MGERQEFLEVGCARVRRVECKARPCKDGFKRTSMEAPAVNYHNGGVILAARRRSRVEEGLEQRS